MPTEKQNNELMTDPSWPTFDSVYKSLVKLTQLTPEDRRFPVLELETRLLNIGLREFLEEGEYRDNQGKRVQGRALDVLGFPFKFVSQLDEAILATAKFLRRFSDEEGSTLNLYALHRLSKGEEKNLAFWQTPKAKLYIELQNIILLLNNVGERTSTISRILTFSKVEDLAFLTQPAISVLSEQFAARIKLGFLFLDTFEREGDEDIGPISNAVLLNFIPRPTSSPEKPKGQETESSKEPERTLDFYALRGVLEEKKAHDLPYQDRCTAKWYANKASAILQDQHLGNFVQLFEEDWEPISAKPKGICGFPGSGSAVFNRATLMMYQAFNRGKTRIKPEDFRKRINETVITRDLIRLERTMAAFDENGIDEIKAVDATSVKDTLRIHSSNPTYRQWLRRSLNHVLADPGNKKSLSRIYILEDRKNKDPKTNEFQTLVREMQYYLDYLNYEMSEMRQIVTAHSASEEVRSKTNDSLVRKRNSFKNRIHVYVTTSSILYNFAHQVLEETHPAMIKEILRSPYSPDMSASIASIQELLLTLDYLYTDGPHGMVYNFLNQRADPGELRFEASVYRATLDIDKETDLLFDFLYKDSTFLPEDRSDRKAEDALNKLRDKQLQSRIQFVILSIREYVQKYDRILKRELPNRSYATLKKKIESVSAQTTPKDLLRIRRTIETALYKYFAPRFTHLYELLEYCSVEVDLFPAPTKGTSRSRLAAREIKDVYPFKLCRGSNPFAETRETPSDQLFRLLETKIKKRLRVKGSIPRFREKSTRSEPPRRSRERTSGRTPISDSPIPTIGIITALEKEYVAVSALLENVMKHSVPGRGAGRRYRIGEIPASEGGRHLIALALLQEKGNNSAATRATRLLEHFPSVNTIIMVGIAGGVPFPAKADEHVRLGDIVVSDRDGVVKYDYVKESDDFENRHPPRPPKATLIEAVKLLKASELEQERPWLSFINVAAKKLKVRRPSQRTDVLTSSTDHKIIVEHPKDPERNGAFPRVFRGPIASADRLLKNPIKRDQLREKFKVKAIEMEGSGIADATWELETGYLVVRGICDYCDHNKGDVWQKYAAIAAAAYTRSLLESMPVQ
jgi:nucleoside phosphorylase